MLTDIEKLRQAANRNDLTKSKIYTQEMWQILVINTINNINSLSKLKGDEYAGDNDRLANFRRNGNSLEVRQELIWAVYAGKHWDAIIQYVKDKQQGKTRQRSESISGRLDDLIVYCILMKAIVEENGD